MGNSVRWLVFLFAATFLLAGLLSIHPVGEPINTAMDDYFLAWGQAETGANNIVTSVVFDYRAFDTLGEATVLFTAVSGIVALFRGVKTR